MIIKEGWIFVIGFSALGFVCISITPWTNFWAVVSGILFFILACFCLFFFRNPERVIVRNERAILSSADGRIMEIVPDYRSGNRQGTLVKIFLSIFDVHIQRSPVDGAIADITYNKGRFLPAMNQAAFTDNEKNTLVIKHSKGIIEVSQIAGIIARRIICWFKKGDQLNAGQRFGLICFGSQVDMLLPGSVSIHVKKGMRVQAGMTVIGVWQ